MQKSTHAVPRMDLGYAFHEYSPASMRFIADQVLPIRPVRQEASTLSVTQRKNLTLPETKHANGATYNRVELYMTDLAYACVDHGLEGQLTDRDRAKYADDFDAEVEKVAGVKIKMMLSREKRVVDLIFNTTTWTGAALYTDNSGTPWDTVTTNVITQIGLAKEKVRLGSGVTANALVIGQAAMENLLKNTVLSARFPGVQVITEEMLRVNMAAIFGLEKLIVGGSVYNSADEGQTFSGSDMWGDDYAMVARLSADGLPLSEPQLGRTILWERYTPDLDYVEQYREEQTKSDIFRVEQSVDEKIFDPAFAHLMKIDT